MSIDPRIRARRVAVLRAEGRRRLRFLGVVVGLVLLALGAWGLTRTPLLDLDHIRVEGVEGRIEGQRVLAVTDLETTTPMFDLDLGAAEASITELAWVRSADARRDWPGTVVIDVVPRVAVAQIGSGDARFLVDDEGILIAESTAAASVPLILNDASVGLGEVDPTAATAIPVAVAVPDDLLPWLEGVRVLSEVDSAGRSLLELDLLGEAVVRFGTAELIDDKIAAVRAVLNDTRLACLSEIDVTTPDLNPVYRDRDCAETSEDAAN